MTIEENELWNKIEKFELDEAGDQLQFSQRLARENGWSVPFARNVILEYKRFIFLCCISKTSCTPSDEVDQAWHLHITYTRSYWKKLCGEVLNRELHHDPTKGGSSESAKFHDYYAETLALYERTFGTKPPEEIWPTSAKRFAKDEFQRVNKADYFLIPKLHRKYRRRALIIALVTTSALCIQASDSQVELGIGFILATLVISIFWGSNGGRGNSGCGSGGCSWSGCSTGHSGCSSSGCSGCGGGCGGCGG